MTKKVFSFRASEETENYLRYLMQNHDPSMTNSICDAIRWFAEKRIHEDSLQQKFFYRCVPRPLQ